MSISPDFSRTIRFADFELDLETAELRSNGSRTTLPGQPFQILVRLLDRPGQLVTREELKKQLWPSETFVDFDVSLNKAVNRLREALDDSAAHPRFIETLPRRGYRFVGIVESGNPNGTASVAKPALLDEDPNPTLPAVLVEDLVPGQAVEKARRIRSLRHLGLATAYCLAVAAALFTLWSRPRKSPVPELANVHFLKLTGSGRVHDVAISPDGRYVIYSLSDGEQESLHISQVAARNEVQILPPGPGFHGLTFSPDGDYVYFVRSDANDPFFKYLYSMPMLGGDTRRMIADVDSPISFSPDGHQFVFERAVVARSLIELRVANADGSGEHVLANIQNGDAGLFQPGPSWSRDGRAIIVPVRFGDLVPQRRWVLESVSVPEGKMREVYSSPFPLGRPIWLSDGTSLLIPHWDSEYERAQLWTISYPGGHARRFSNDLADYDSPLDVTRNGKVIASIASSVVSNVFVAPVENLLSTRQITSGVLPMMGIIEAADGKVLSLSGDGRLWRFNSDGSGRELFIDVDSVGRVRRCGPSILLISREANTTTLTRVSEDGSRRLRLMSGDLHYPGCSPDGKFVYYVNKHRPQKIWKLSTEGGVAAEVGPALGVGVTGQLDVSPDGTLLAYAFDENRPPRWNLAVIPAGGGPAVKTFHVPGGIGLPRWSPDGSALHYLATQNGAANIWEQAIAGGDPRQLTHFASGLIFDYTWSSDRQRLLMTRGEVTSDVVVLSNLR
jgi:DNA-binding winged helix-turn-helix (wHTH) protein/Tol biopolymer transport system component